MPFRKKTREYWMQVGNNECQWLSYSEAHGFKKCGREARHVHHIIPESKLIAQGRDPNAAVGMPLCENHHVRNLDGEIYDDNSSFHPEMGYAYKDYKEWKGRAQHLAEINNKSIDYSTSPFADVAKEYKKRSTNGERICTGDESTDLFYTDEMRMQALRLSLEKGIRKPKAKSQAENGHKKRWRHNIL